MGGMSIPAIILIDLQRHFRMERPDRFGPDLIRNVQQLRNIATDLHIPVIHVLTRYRLDRSNWPSAWKNQPSIWCLEGTEGVLPVSGVEPNEKEIVVTKSRYSAFYETELEATLRGLGVSTLLIAGYSTDVCVRFTTIDAYNRGFQVMIVKDCVRAMREDDDASIEYLCWLTNARPVSVLEIPRTLKE